MCLQCIYDKTGICALNIAPTVSVLDVHNGWHGSGWAAQLPDTESSRQQKGCHSASEIVYIVLAE